MGRIVRLTEQDLARIVRRVINENEQTKYQQLYTAVAGAGTDEETFLKVIESIRDKAEYDKINAIGKAKGEDIISLFDGDFGGGTNASYRKRFCTKISHLGVTLPKSCFYKDLISKLYTGQVSSYAQPKSAPNNGVQR
jgi:phosphopantetheinyl transferase (holo-ACP synthase)